MRLQWLALALLATRASAAIFTNPLAGLADMMGPTEGPISTRRGNFAIPAHPNLRTLQETPPVYEIPGFLSDDECDALIAATRARKFPAVPYGKKNKIFTGTKWAAHKQDPLVDLFLERACTVFGDCPEARFDPITVTRYSQGEFQAKHLDARLPHQVVRNKAYMASGGQRIAQLICYLQAPAAGGETRFFGPAFSGLAVKPTRGTALVFPTATLEGLADERYLHSGEPVGRGDKWIVGTWLMEAERTDGADVARAIKELWKLDAKRKSAR